MERHGRARRRARGDHPGRTEDLGPDVVAVGGGEAGLGDAIAPLSKRITTTAVSSRPASLNSGATRASAMAYTSTGRAPGLSQQQRVEVVDQGLGEDRPRRHAAPGWRGPGRGSATAAGAACRSPPATTASCAAAKSGAKRRLKPTCSGTPASLGRGDRAVGVGEGQRHRLLAEDRLACLGGRDDEVGVRVGRRGDHDGLDVVRLEDVDRVGEHASRTRTRAEGVGRLGPRVRDGDQARRPGHGWRDRGVRGADPAGADESDRDDARDSHGSCLSVDVSVAGATWPPCVRVVMSPPSCAG